MNRPACLLAAIVACLSVDAAVAQSGGNPPQSPRATMTQDSTAENAKASLGEAGTGSYEFRLSYYDNDDNGDGNPFLDESLSVIEPVVYFDLNVTDTFKVWSQLSVDVVSSASIERLRKYPQQSGASGDLYIGVDLGVTHQSTPEVQLGGNVHVSNEYDYNSLGLGAFLARDYDGHNTTLKATGSVYLDSLDVIRFNGVNEGTDDRLALNGAIDWYQVINPRTHGEFGLGLTYQDGMLSTPYNAVVVLDPTDPPNNNLPNYDRGTEIAEVLPDTRFRGALHGRVRHAVSDHWALELGGRLYADDWGVVSSTLEPRAYTWLVQDRLRLRLRYRFYAQSAADGYGSSFLLTAPAIRTQDSDLGAFDAHTMGARLDWFDGGGWRVDVGGDYTLRSDGLDFLFLSIGSSRKF
ncbi:MAG: DUF3570 domain-containing protein [Planctomycetes bacterium]|nr:DUF3570 domain-containing protein [Planctomycetota bacterium]